MERITTAEDAVLQSMGVVEDFCEVHGWDGITALLGACVEWSVMTGRTENFEQALDILPDLLSRIHNLFESEGRIH